MFCNFFFYNFFLLIKLIDIFLIYIFKQIKQIKYFFRNNKYKLTKVKFKNIFKQLNLININLPTLFSFCIRLNKIFINLILFIFLIFNFI